MGPSWPPFCDVIGAQEGPILLVAFLADEIVSHQDTQYEIVHKLVTTRLKSNAIFNTAFIVIDTSCFVQSVILNNILVVLFDLPQSSFWI